MVKFSLSFNLATSKRLSQKMRLNRLHKLVLWSLIGLNTGVPVPWAHRHSDLESSESVLHRQFLHQPNDGMGAATWHLHFFDPKQPLPENDRKKCPFADFTFISSLQAEEISRLDLCHRVKNLGQHAVQSSDVFDLIGGCLTRLDSHCNTIFGRQALASCEVLCTWQI